MSETIKARWLTDENQNKVAPKTLSSQIITSDGELYEDKVTNEIATQIANAIASYYTKEEIDSMELITVDEVDAICGASIYAANEVAL